MTISYCSLSFVCHFNLLPLQKELQRPTKKRMNIIMIGSILLAYGLYNLVIFSGLFRVSRSTHTQMGKREGGKELRELEGSEGLSTAIECMFVLCLVQFYDEIKVDVMLNYSRDDILMTTARIAIFFTLLFSYPVLLHPTRSAINRLLLYVYQLVKGCMERRGKGGESEVVNTGDDGESWTEDEKEESEEKTLIPQKETKETTSDVKV